MTPHFGRIEVVKENEDDYGIPGTPFSGTVIRFSCEPGYHLHDGPSERTCQANGRRHTSWCVEATSYVSWESIAYRIEWKPRHAKSK